MNTSSLNRIMTKNKVEKVKQLSEIAVLFEREKRVGEKAAQISTLSTELKDQGEISLKLTRELPAGFLEQENKKREKLISTISACQNEITDQLALVVERQRKKAKELEKTNSCLAKIREKTRRNEIETQIANEILDSEENLALVSYSLIGVSAK